MNDDLFATARLCGEAEIASLCMLFVELTRIAIKMQDFTWL